MRRNAVLLGTALALLIPPMTGCARPDIVVDDFERTSYAPWLPLGTAFSLGPMAGGGEDQRPVAGFYGQRLVNTFVSGDGATGYLISPEFVIERDFLNFLIGGGDHPGRTGLELYVEGAYRAGATGHAARGGDSEHLRWHSWNVKDDQGRRARLVAVDQHTGGWGHLNLDHIIQSDRMMMKETANPLVQKVWNSVLGAAAWADSDPARPIFHFRPPALWMNDPNGLLFYDGWYHLFYQHNPFGDRWDTMHWGHARSRDMVRWEHLPVALWPDLAGGEAGVWSGSAALDEEGKPMLFYTSIRTHTTAREYAEQWIARPLDDDLIAWEKPAGNPIMTPSLHGEQMIFEWRDPFLFTHAGKTLMVNGGNIQTGPDQFRGVVALYEAKDATLTEWMYRGILFEHPVEWNIECPNFFPLGDKFVLVLSLPGWRAAYHIGSFDAESGRFTSESEGMIDHGAWYYAPNSLEDAQGRRVMWGWVRGFPEDKGWNGVQSLPRVLSLAEDGGLRLEPLPELQTLRGGQVTLENLEVTDGVLVLPEVRGNTIEIAARIESAGASRFGIRVRTNVSGDGGVAIGIDGGTVRVDGDDAAHVLESSGAPVDLRLFLDRSVLEVFVNGRGCFTRVLAADEGNLSIALFAEGGTARIARLDAWEMGSASVGEEDNLTAWVLE